MEKHIKDLIARAYYDGIQKGKFGVVENGTTGALEMAEVYASKIEAAEQSVQSDESRAQVDASNSK